MAEVNNMIKNLVIVESPAKAKTIEKFLGKDFIVRSCFGHVRDLASDELSVDVEHDFKPKYVVPEDKKKVVSELKKLAKEAEQIWLATDEDREGEAISWHLLETLDLEEDKTKRIVFHEITKPAIMRAIENPRRLDKNLVNAQQARRILDRLVGFELSPVLWKKIQPALSAGRVQSVAVRLVVEREREINQFQYKSAFRITANLHPLDANGKAAAATIKAELPERFNTEAEARKFLETCLGANFLIADIEVKPAQKSPSAPFTTSTLQQEASRKLGFSVTRTMVIAQKLYEAGHITYMRTDSVNLSEEATTNIENEVKKVYGNSYAHTRKFANKNQSAQEAHEAIRPTYIQNQVVDGEDAEKRLYDLIWKRTIASQMANARLEKTNVKIDISTTKQQMLATGEVLKFDGFLKVYLESKDDEDDEETSGILPPLNVGQKLSLAEMVATERYNRPPARYTEASLVRKLEELGIGRPSTYAPTITTIQKRGYAIKGEQSGEERNYRVLSLKSNAVTDQTLQEIFGKEKSKLFPTNTGIIVNDFLLLHFDKIMDYKFTASVEKEFDEIAQGGKEWQKMLENFYTPFHDNVENTIKTTDRVKGERLLGIDPASGKPVYAKMGRFGPVAQIGEISEDEKPKYARLRKDQLIETITLEEAFDLFKLPRELGEYEGMNIAVAIGRFGPYLSHNKQFYSLPKEEDPYTVEFDRAIEIIKEKIIEKANKIIQEFEFKNKPVQLLRGRFGPYISFDKNNYKIPKSVVPEQLSLEEVIKIIEEKPATNKGGARGGKGAKSAAKTTEKAAPKSAAKSNAKTTAKTATKSVAKKKTKK